MSKAWMYECFDPDDGVMVIFADRRTEAKQIAYAWDAQYVRYTDIRVRRCSFLDHLNHEAGYVMDWSKYEDRIEILKMACPSGYCDGEPMDTGECEYCWHAQYCDPYQDWLEEEKEKYEQ